MKNKLSGIRLQGQGGVIIAIVLGILLIVNPDFGTGAVGIAIGAALIVIGVIILISVARRLPVIDGWELAIGIVAAVAGGTLVRNPQLVGKILGYCVSVVLILRGARSLSAAKKSGAFGEEEKRSRIVAVATLVVGIILFIVPLTSSRILMRLAGVVMLLVGLMNAGADIRLDRFLRQNEDSNIIDADE